MLARAAIQSCAPSLSAAAQSQSCVIVYFIMQHDENMGNLAAAVGNYNSFRYYKDQCI